MKPIDSNNKIIVVETIQAVVGKKNELRKALLVIVTKSRKAPGCLRYELFEPYDQTDQFLILMEWEKLEDLRNHEASDYVEQFVKKYDQVLYNEAHVSEWTKVE